MEYTFSNIHWKTSSFLMRQKKLLKKGVSRWISEDSSQYYEWDILHGEIEVYNRRGYQVSILNADGSLSAKEPKPGRKIDV
jgi:hypothetical protein